MKNEANIILENFGKKIKQIRNSQKISQSQLAYETGLTREFINKLENGKLNISLLNIYSIADALNINIIALFSDINVKDE